MAARLVSEFEDRAIATGDDKVIGLAYDDVTRQGAFSIAKILRYAMPAYKALLAEEVRPPDMQELELSLRASSDVIRPFAATDRGHAALLEDMFGIVADIEMPAWGYNPVPFVFERRPEIDELHYAPSMPLLQLSNLLIENTELTGKYEVLGKHRKCPALGVVMEGFWQRGVTICTTGPALYPNDLSPQPVLYSNVISYG